MAGKRERKRRRPPLLLRLLRGILALALLGGALAFYAFKIEPRWIQTTELEVTAPIEGSLRIVALGDTHIGMGKDQAEMGDLVGRINAIEPDAVFFLGDLFDNYAAYTGDVEANLAILAGIEAEYKYAVRGNHDVGGGAEFVYPELIAQAGFTLLENTDARLPCGLHIIGAADYIYHTPNLEGLTGEGFDLLLAHEPDLADAVSGVELQLSGHSHGGQVYLPFLVQEFLPGGAQNYIRGRYEKADGGIVYVNRGIGMSMLPVRLFSRPEITILTIHGEE